MKDDYFMSMLAFSAVYYAFSPMWVYADVIGHLLWDTPTSSRVKNALSVQQKIITMF